MINEPKPRPAAERRMIEEADTEGHIQWREDQESYRRKGGPAKPEDERRAH